MLTQIRWHQVLFVLLSAIIFLAYIFLPVWLTPGNDLEFQLSLLRMKDYSLFVSLSFVTSLLILMQVFLAIRTKKYRERLRAVGGGGVSLFSSIFGGLLATLRAHLVSQHSLDSSGQEVFFLSLDIKDM